MENPEPIFVGPAMQKDESEVDESEAVAALLFADETAPNQSLTLSERNVGYSSNACISRSSPLLTTVTEAPLRRSKRQPSTQLPNLPREKIGWSTITFTCIAVARLIQNMRRRYITRRLRVYVDVPPRMVAKRNNLKRRQNYSDTAIKVEDEEDKEYVLNTAVGTRVQVEDDDKASREVRPDQEHDLLNALRHPDVKIKMQKVMTLDQVVYQRLTAHHVKGYKVGLSPELRNFIVKRIWMGKVFGGSPHKTFPKILHRRVEQHGYDNFLYASFNFHLDAPKYQGGPGLWYSLGRSSAWKAPSNIVFVNIRAGSWLYVGQYEAIPVESLTTREWLLTPNKVRKRWGRKILKQKWGRRICVRVKFRRTLGRDPTAEQLNATVGTDINVSDVTSEEVVAEFDAGRDYH